MTLLETEPLPCVMELHREKPTSSKVIQGTPCINLKTMHVTVNSARLMRESRSLR